MSEHYYRLETQIEKVQKEMLKLKDLLLLQPDKQTGILETVGILEEWKLSAKGVL